MIPTRRIAGGLVMCMLAATGVVTAGDPDEQPARSTGCDATVSLTEVAADWGLEFTHFSGATGHYYFPEIAASGCGFFDYDNDGDLDVYLVQGNVVPGAEPRAGTQPPRNRLFRNELISSRGSRGEVRFTDVTDESGTGDAGCGMGVAAGDYDNDGDVDLYVTNLGPDVLFRNNGDGTFSDVTARAGLGDPRWTTSATFFDLDRDGHLDLAVTGYADYSVAIDKICTTPRGDRDYCGPSAYRPVPDRLYRNRGDGTFADVTAETGMERAYGHGLGVAAADFDGNGWADLYVANDGDANQVWMNRDGRLADQGLLSGAAVNYAGNPEAGMGVLIEDFDDDGDPDLFVTHLFGETNTLYENIGGGFFEDRTSRTQLGLPSIPRTGFGTAAVDLDHDADLDIVVANGGVHAVDTEAAAGNRYHQPNQVFIHEPGLIFVEHAVPELERPEVSRGLAAGDVDNDGDVDVLITNKDAPVRLFRNDLDGRGNWLLLRVMDAQLKRDAVGAAVRLTLSDGRVLTRYVTTGGSYCSARDPRVHFGWPAGLSIESVRIELPSGRSETVEGLAPRSIATAVITADGAEVRR